MSVLTRDPVSDRVHKWLGRLPAGWTGGRLFEIADAWTSNVDKHTVEGQPPVRLCNYVDVYKNSSIVGALDFMAASATREQIETFRIRVGDTLITKDSETADDIGVPAFVEYEADDLICGYHLAIVRPDRSKADPKFLYWVLESEPIARQWSVAAAGVTRVGIRSADLNKVTIPLPPLDEQRAIADYLDREADQIDALVAKQEELVAALQERRSAIVDHLLMSGSLGRSRLKNLLVQNDSGVWGDDANGSDGTVVLRSTEQTVDGRWKISEPALRELSEKEFNAARLEVNDLVLTKTSGSQKHIGKTTLVDERIATLPACHGNFMQRLRAKSDVSARFLWYCLNSRIVREQLVLLSTTSTGLANLNGGSIGSVHVPVHEGGQQTAIAEQIDEETSRIDTLIAKAEEHIALAKERRSALITAAVTGQFDVRTARKAG